MNIPICYKNNPIRYVGLLADGSFNHVSGDLFIYLSEYNGLKTSKRVKFRRYENSNNPKQPYFSLVPIDDNGNEVSGSGCIGCFVSAKTEDLALKKMKVRIASNAPKPIRSSKRK
jgi:hypothetical protein